MAREQLPYPIVGTPWYAIDLPIGVVVIDAQDAAVVATLSLAWCRTRKCVHGNTGSRKNRRSCRLTTAILGSRPREHRVWHRNNDRLDFRRDNLIEKPSGIGLGKHRFAHKTVERAVGRGRLIRQPCEACGSEHRIHAHHDDYLRPLDIRWLCASCHMTHHWALRRQKARRESLAKARADKLAKGA